MVKRRSRARTSKGYTYLGSAAGLRASRRRRVRRGIALVCLALSLAGVGYGVIRLVDWAGRSNAFAVKEIHVLGNRKLAVNTVAAAAGIRPNDNLLRISPTEVERSVSAIPQVKRAFVQRRLPDELVIRVAERRPCFLVNCGCLWLVDREGVVVGRGSAGDMERFTMATGFGPATVGLGASGGIGDSRKGAGAGSGTPAETGAGKGRNAHFEDEMHLEPGVRLDPKAVHRIMETIRAIEECSPDLCRMVSEICLTPDGELAVFTSDPPHRVTLGRERPLAESLVALGPVLDDLRRRGLVGMEVDLRFQRQLVVRSIEGRVAMREES